VEINVTSFSEREREKINTQYATQRPACRLERINKYGLLIRENFPDQILT
jgi:hypothetical protein